MGKKKGKAKSEETKQGVVSAEQQQQPQPSTSHAASAERPTPAVEPAASAERPSPAVEPAASATVHPTSPVESPEAAELGAKKPSGKQKKKKKTAEPLRAEATVPVETSLSELEITSGHEQKQTQSKQPQPQPTATQQPQPQRQPTATQQPQPQSKPLVEELGGRGDVGIPMPQQAKKKGKQKKQGDAIPVQPETGARPKHAAISPQPQVTGIQFGQVPGIQFGQVPGIQFGQVPVASREQKVTSPEVSAKKARPEIGSGDASARIKEQRKSQKPTQKVQPQPRTVAKPLPQTPQIAEAEKGIKPPKRKDLGKRGTAIKLRANHFAVKIDPKKRIYHYDIEIKPELKAMKGLKRNIVEVMVTTNKALFGRASCVFDGEKNLYASAQLEIGVTGQQFSVTLPEKKEKFTVDIKRVAEILLADLQEFLDGKTRIMPQYAVQALDIVFRHLPTLRYITLGRSIFPITDRGFDLEGGVEMWRGYYQSLRPGSWKHLQLNLDVSNRTFYKAQSVLEFAAEFFRLRSPEDLRRLDQRDWSKFAKEVKGMSVQVTHTLNPRKYKLIGLSPRVAELQTFPLTQNETTVECTVAKFFMDTYQKRLSFGRIPCLQAQPADKHRYLPMEVCKIPVGQQYKKLSDQQTAAMIRKTAVPAPQREQDIRNLMHNARLNQDPYVRGFGLSVSDELMVVDGRILPPPSLQLNSRITPNLGVWDMRQKQFFRGARIDEWGVINVASRCHRDAVVNFCTQLRRVAREIGIVMAEPLFYQEFQRLLPDHIFREFKQKSSNLKLILAILPGKTPLYATIKRMGDTEVGIITQCVQEKNVNIANPATLTNILMKINAKMGGINSILSEGRSKVFSRPVIFLGADVTHPPAGDKSKPSIAAIVGSMDMNAQEYTAKVCVQEHRKEIIVDLKQQVRELLLEFYKTHRGAKPERIIFYRDGVGEGQFYEVLRHELVAIRGACSSLSQEYKPAITFLVVQKRHHTRLFCENDREAVGRARNVPPGTTVDTAITHPVENDFFLCSHQGIQGTSRPTHYHVLWDDNDFSADELHQLTYDLCHTYVRCTRSVSIPAPAYYAHLVAFRARYHLEKLQERVDQERGDPNDWLGRMQEAVKIHESTGRMYYV